jgi:hypothetical protein
MVLSQPSKLFRRLSHGYHCPYYQEISESVDAYLHQSIPNQNLIQRQESSLSTVDEGIDSWDVEGLSQSDY